VNREHSRVEAIYRAALGVAPSARGAFLRDACGDDELLRSELEARLQQTVGDFEETRSVYAGTVSTRSEWGGLRLLGEIGAGGFGRVYRAHDSTLDRDVALKIISLRTQTDAATVLREGQMLARVRHRNVVTVHSAQRVADEVGVTMELVEGQNLAELIRVNGPMGAEEAAVIGLSICQALAAVHAAGLVHRDVKARNVMRERGGRIVLMDFGLGLDRAAPPDANSISGTPPYMAPELFMGQPATPAADLYALGVLLFFLVSADYPVSSSGSVAAVADAHARGIRRYLADLRPDLPSQFVKVVEQALAPDPVHRFATAGAMVRALGDAIPEAADEHAGRVAQMPIAADPKPVLVWVTAMMGILFGVGALGLVTTAVFNITLQRAGFSDDSVADWFVLGAQSLVAPLISAVLLLAVIFAGRLVWRLLRRGMPPLVERTEASARSLSQATGLADPVSRAQWLLAAQTVALGIFVWQFYDVFRVVTDFPDFVDPTATGLLSERSSQPVLYRQSMTVLLILSVLAWWRVLRQADGRLDASTKAGAAIVSAVMLLVLTMPYRLMFLSDRPVVEYRSLRCYDLGRRDSQVLVYCPAWEAPRIRETNAAELIDTGVDDLVFNGR